MSSEENIYICQQCQNLFKLDLTGPLSNNKELICTKCGSTQIQILPSWSPAGSDLHEVKSEWEYQCQNCHNVFKLPIPASPSQEKEITCPECDGSHIHRLTPTGGEPLYCG